MILATVAVRHPADSSVRMVINEDDLTDRHVLWGEPGDGVDHDMTPASARVGKGPRGKWYVIRGQERVAGPFDTEADATSAAALG